MNKLMEVSSFAPLLFTRSLTTVLSCHIHMEIFETMFQFCTSMVVKIVTLLPLSISTTTSAVSGYGKV